METRISTRYLDDVEAQVEYRYYPGERAVRNVESRVAGPGINPAVEIERVQIGGRWLDAVYMAPRVLNRFAEEILSEHEAEAWA
jgi:hypothetical protein